MLVASSHGSGPTRSCLVRQHRQAQRGRSSHVCHGSGLVLLVEQSSRRKPGLRGAGGRGAEGRAGEVQAPEWANSPGWSGWPRARGPSSNGVIPSQTVRDQLVV